jgi:hypothetical protein
MNVKKVLGHTVLFGALSLTLTATKACDGTSPNVDDPKNGTAQCVVADRSYNSNGTLVLAIDCNGGGEGYGPGGGVRAEVDPNAHPMCRTGAAWPGCREG